jgi:hypothetical protein
MCARLLGLRDKPARMYGWIIALVTAVHAAAGLAREQACSSALPGGWGHMRSQSLCMQHQSGVPVPAVQSAVDAYCALRGLAPSGHCWALAGGTAWDIPHQRNPIGWPLLWCSRRVRGVGHTRALGLAMKWWMGVHAHEHDGETPPKPHSRERSPHHPQVDNVRLPCNAMHPGSSCSCSMEHVSILILTIPLISGRYTT